VITGVVDTGDKFLTGDNDTGNKLTPVTTIAVNIIASDNDTGDKFIAGDNNKDAMEVGSCQGWEKVEGDKSVISPATKGGHNRRWCHWNRHEKLHP
jgi:hypothetical protein